jgi:hypothetical protein
MNARKTFFLSLAVALTAVSATQAGPVVGTNKARGDFSRGGWEMQSGRAARSQPAYRYSAPVYRAPAIQTAPAPMVAQAPEEGRRFSYAPSTPAAAGVPCPPAQAQATTVEEARRFSYAPSTETAVAPSVEPAPRIYSSPRPSYSAGGRSRLSVERWALPKADPRKYSTR